MSELYDGGYNAGHEDYDLHALHAEQGSEHDSYTNFNQFAATHAEESDVHFANYHNVEASDGHGGYYSETDITEYDAHNASADTIYAQDYTNIEHNANYSQLDELRESFERDYLTTTAPEALTTK
jgi:hypothetical protein